MKLGKRWIHYERPLKAGTEQPRTEAEKAALAEALFANRIANTVRYEQYARYIRHKPLEKPEEAALTEAQLADRIANTVRSEQYARYKRGQPPEKPGGKFQPDGLHTEESQTTRQIDTDTM